ncbi:MAG: hypothetical protein LBP95_01215, partial [Deltaproteobacteria bacterium]|nr:hypothetical protein [Deltaproteobacteria bacterium]
KIRQVGQISSPTQPESRAGAGPSFAPRRADDSLSGDYKFWKTKEETMENTRKKILGNTMKSVKMSERDKYVCHMGGQ